MQNKCDKRLIFARFDYKIENVGAIVRMRSCGYKEKADHIYERTREL